jgi:hypothetical protein
MDFRRLYESTRVLLDRKLGRCPRCMGSSILGCGLSWLAVATLNAMWPNRLAMMFGLATAVAFTALMITHIVVHMFHSAPIVRQLQKNQGSGQSRREFALGVAQSGFGFAAAALVTLPLIPKRAQAAGTRTYATYCVGKGCALAPQGSRSGGIGVLCTNLGFKYGTFVSVACGRKAPTNLSCNSHGCDLQLELVAGNTSCAAATASVVSLSGFKCGGV